MVDQILFDRVHGAFPHQQAMVEEVAFGNAYASGLVGGYGSGKSKTLAYCAVMGAAINPGLQSLCVEPTYRMIGDVLVPAFEDLFEANSVPYAYNKTDQIIYLPWWDHRLLLRSSDNPKRLKGSNCAAGHVDEPGIQPEDVWVQVQARVRDPKAEKLIRACYGTPEGLGWFYEYFGTDRANYRTIRAKTTDNKTLPPEYIRELLESMDEAHAKAYLEGLFVPLWQAMVYYNFDRKVHAARPLKYDPTEPLFWSHDFNVNPMCSVVFQLVQSGGRRHVHFIDEMVVPNSNTPEVCREFLRRYADHEGVVYICGDPSGKARDTRQESARSDFDIMQDMLDGGLRKAEVSRYIDRSAPSLRRRFNTTNALLKSASGAVQLYVDPKCKGLIASFEQTVRKEGVEEIDKKVRWKFGRHTFEGVEHPTDAATYPLCKLFRDPREILRTKEAA